ncbi:helix-turn-helix transcriptional regulator [Microbispora sp. NPDC046933]|uniref:helix-turn-helix domain-containing protein n=1 Tax=Microbispora sp. NPDC046933 TaxID=3155618 RepID=UPI0033ECEA8B
MKDEEAGNQLGSYLRARRELVSPAQAGLPPGGNRRVPGLRREEVALLAGISPALRLERGRDKNPSPQVLESLARVLQLDEITAATCSPSRTPPTTSSARCATAPSRSTGKL